MTQTTFIGRTAELQWLGEFLKKADGGQFQVALIAGEAGTGKSSLVEEFLRIQEESDARLITAIGECNAQTGAGDPYLPFRQVLTSLTTEPLGQRPADEIAKAKKTARLRESVRISSQTLIKIGPDLIGIFVPGGNLLTSIATQVALSSNLADKLSEKVVKKRDGEAAQQLDPRLDQEKIFEQYASVLQTLSTDQTLVLVLDDLQWADSASLNLLFHLARQLKDSRILLLGTYRPDDVALGRNGERHPFQSILNELKRYHGDIVMDLSRSSLEEGGAFTNDLIDSEPNRLDSAFRGELFSRTGGSAFYR